MAPQPKFSGLHEQLLSKKDWVDIAPSGTARQSSVSRWSRQNDAQRAVDPDVDSDFAFHTKIEVNPWWEVEFSRDYFPDVIVIENRRNPLHQRHAQEIEVTIFDEKNRESKVFYSISNFGALPYGIPIIIPVSKAYQARRIRITALGKTVLHLSKVRILVDPINARSAGKTIIKASRTDGLGQRLMAIINGLAVANLDERFIFLYNWPPLSKAQNTHHAIVPDTAFFSKDFVEKYSAPAGLPDAHVSFYSPKIRETTNLEEAILQHPVVAAQPEDIFEKIPGSSKSLTPDDIQNAYKKITYAPKIETVRKMATEIELGDNSVAIHLRAGDIIYGKFRFVDRFAGKVTPYGLAEELVSSEKSKGSDIIIFGQDKELCEYLRDTHDVRISQDLCGNVSLDAASEAVFDITLLSRCRRVFSGSSGFAQIACMISGKNNIDSRGVFPKEDLLKITQKYLDVADSRVSNLQRAFSCWYAAHIGQDNMTPKNRIDFLKKAIGYDPENGFYMSVLASVAFGAGLDDIGEAALKTALAVSGAGRLLRCVTQKHPDGIMNFDKYAPQIRNAADRGREIAQPVAAAYEMVRHEKTDRVIGERILSDYGFDDEWKIVLGV